MTKKAKKVKSKSYLKAKKKPAVAVEAVKPLNLRALALDIVEGKVFGSWQLHNPAKELSMVFLALLFANKEDTPTDIGAVYEYMSSAGVGSINGYPIFYSCRFLTMQQYKDVCAYVKEAREHRKSFLETNDTKELKTDTAEHTQPTDSNQQMDSRGGTSGSERNDASNSESSDNSASNRLRKLFERTSGSYGFTTKTRN